MTHKRGYNEKMMFKKYDMNKHKKHEKNAKKIMRNAMREEDMKLEMDMKYEMEMY